MTPQPPQGGANTLSSVIFRTYKWNLSCFHRHCEEWNDEAILIMQNKIILSSGLLRRVASLRSQWRASISEFRKSDRGCFAALAMTCQYIGIQEEWQGLLRGARNDTPVYKFPGRELNRI